MTFAFVHAEKARFPIAFMCDRLGVSTSGYYDWVARQTSPSAKQVDDEQLTATITEIHRQSRGTYGSPRVTAELRMGLGMTVNHKRVERLMRRAGLQGVTRRRRHRTARRNPATISDDLVRRRFDPDGPDQLWVADITQHPTDQGWIYCAVVIDAWSRLVVGHAIGDHPRTELVVDALDTARWRRQPDPGLVFHSDHGTQYTSWAFGRRLREAGLLGSMGTVGDALDNAVAESFFASLQTELLDRRDRWPTRTGLANAIFEWIEVFYNRDRRHSTLGTSTRPTTTNAAQPHPRTRHDRYTCPVRPAGGTPTRR